MTYRPDTQHRRSIRLQGYDYSRAGAYFITICAQNRECLFGKIVNGKMGLNNAGMMVQTVWDEIPAHYPGIDIDAFIVMPNHIHGIVVIVGAVFVTTPMMVMGRITGSHRGLPLRRPLMFVTMMVKNVRRDCPYRMWCLDSKP
ncbi:transposase [Desulfobulbus oligotrophicus]|uniref:transposase n=1 Tax=Desulfobulbus oligotrophicus TaxID=1909699 RepID=UPI0018EF0BFC|nr:transposase [Desulfobulbus oligotrophicus]